MRDHMCSLLADDCRRYGAILHAFCVMQHHVHLVVQTPLDKSDKWLMQRIKSNSAKLILPELTPTEATQLVKHARGGRSFWEPSFRGIMITNERARRDCVAYVHLNPVRGGHADTVGGYRWSSGWMYEAGLWTEESGVNDAACEAFPKTLSFS